MPYSVSLESKEAGHGLASELALPGQAHQRLPDRGVGLVLASGAQFRIASVAGTTAAAWQVNPVN